MKLSTKGRYGTKAMLELALHYGEGLILIRDIAKHQGISEKYLEQLLVRLKSAGLVKSVRGARGGYALAVSPAKIRLNKIVSILEGSLFLVDCIEDPKVCSKINVCAPREVWLKMRNVIDGALRSITLEDLAGRQREKEQTAAAMYNI